MDNKRSKILILILIGLLLLRLLMFKEDNLYSSYKRLLRNGKRDNEILREYENKKKMLDYELAYEKILRDDLTRNSSYNKILQDLYKLENEGFTILKTEIVNKESIREEDISLLEYELAVGIIFGRLEDLDSLINFENKFNNLVIESYSYTKDFSKDLVNKIECTIKIYEF